MPLTETISSLTTIVLAAGALVALLFVIYQVREFYRLRQSELRQEKGALLFKIESTFDGREVTNSRIAFMRLWEQVNATVPRENLAADKYAILLSEQFSEQLSRLRDEDLEKYTSIMLILGFFETVGVLVAKDYLELSDVSDLYGGAIIHVDHAFREHIRQRAEHAPPGLYSNILALAASVRELLGLKEAG